MARSAVAMLAFALLATAALAQPCIECRTCNTGFCYQNCRPSCNGIQPNRVAVNGDACRRSGVMFGPQAARSSCDTARRYCEGGQGRMVGARPPRIGTTSLAQCANIAVGSCQQSANNANMGHRCGNELNRGYRQCNAQQFRAFFEGESSEYCYNFAKGLTGVNPGTNQWAGQGQQPGYQQPGYNRPPPGSIAGQIAGNIVSGVVGGLLG